MARLKTKGAQKTELQSGNDIRREIVPPGHYLARVKKAEPNTFKAKQGNPPLSYLKYNVVVELFNDNKTTIQQDVIVGAVDKDGVLYQPDAAKAAEGYGPIWLDAQFFMAAVGFTVAEDFAPELVTGQVVVVSVYTEEYETRDGRSGKKNSVGYVKSNGRIGSGFMALNPEIENNAAWIEEHDLFFEHDAYWVSDADVEAYEEALERLDGADEDGDF